MADEYSTKPTIKKASPPTQCKKPIPKHKFEGHEKAIWSFVFLHDNKHIVSGSEDGTMRKWDCETGLLVGEPWEGEGGEIWALALSPNGNIIACGRKDGSVQQWNTDGKMIKGVWMGHSKAVWPLSWSPSGGHIASGSYDGTILIRTAGNGKIEVGPIKTEQDHVYSLAYSPSGDRIASGGNNFTICIWDSNTGELLVGPIKDLGDVVTSVVWSSDSSKLYSASDKFARVFDSVSGTQLHRFEHNTYVDSVALSPKHNVLACVGYDSVAQLWDTESYQPLGRPFSPEDNATLHCVSFSRDGRYLAYSGNDNKITLWMVKDVAPALPDTRPQLDADATRRKPVARFAGDGRDDFYRDFFQSPQRPHQLGLYRPSRPSERPHPAPARFWSILIPSRRHHREDKSLSRQDRPTRRFFAWRPHSNSPVQIPATTTPTTATSDATKVPDVKENTVDPLDFVHAPLITRNKMDGEGKQRSEPAENTQSLALDAPAPSAKLDSSLKLPVRSLGNHPTSTELSYRGRHTTSPDIVEVPVARGFQRLVARKRKHKTKSKPAVPVGSVSSMAATSSQAACAPIPHASGSSPAGASSQAGPAQAATSSQPAGGSASHIVETHDTRDDSDSDSDSSIQGSWNKFLVRLCFPRGRYHDDRH